MPVIQPYRRAGEVTPPWGVLGKKSILQWIAPNLVRIGLLKNEPWVPLAASAAEELFPHLAETATAMSIVHPRALDYIKQCPVLVLKFDNLETLPIVGRTKLWLKLIEDSPKLRHLMQVEGIPKPLRRLESRALISEDFNVVQSLCRVNPSTLAQTIPTNHLDQHSWLGWLRYWVDVALQKPDPETLEWGVKNAIHFGDSNSEVCDFVAYCNDFNVKWSWQRTVEACRIWHDELQAAYGDAEALPLQPLGQSWEIDYAPLPNHFELGDWSFIALRSNSSIEEEGQIMHHCVRTYVGHVFKGEIRLYSVRKHGVRVATLELRCDLGWLPRWSKWQIKGHCNAKVPLETDCMADKLITHIASNLKLAEEANKNGKRQRQDDSKFE